MTTLTAFMLALLTLILFYGVLLGSTVLPAASHLLSALQVLP